MQPWALGAYSALGDLYRSQGRLTDAAEAYEQAIERGRTQLQDPNVPPLLVSRRRGRPTRLSSNCGQIALGPESGWKNWAGERPRCYG